MSSYFESDFSSVDTESRHDDFSAEDFCPELYDDVQMPKLTDRGPHYLNNKDYTLNSPMVQDELKNFIYYLGGRPYNTLFQTKKIWRERKSWFKSLKKDYTSVKGPESLHKTVADLLLKPQVCTHRIESLIKKTNRDAKGTHLVVQAFLKTWLKKDFLFRTRSASTSGALKYGAYMLDLYIITLALNAADTYEIECLQKKFGMPYTDQSKNRAHDGIRYQSETLGTIYIGYGCAYFDNLKMIWDRNMILMFKDLCTARFHALLAIENRYDDMYNEDHNRKIIEIYKEGDRLMKQVGDSAYDVFSMIEPICSYRLSLIAGDHRPLIPRFDSFPKHIELKTKEIVEKLDCGNNFFQLLHDLTDKMLLLTVYGSFRHWGHPYIDYIQGLKALFDNVNQDTVIDEKYAKQLASDLAYMILYGQFHKHKVWALKLDLLSKDHLLYEYVKYGIWPDKDVTKLMPNGWDDLPLDKCYDIPEFVEPPIMYSDKTHSITRDQLLEHIQKDNKIPIPTKKVIESFIYEPPTNWPVFLKQVNDIGLHPNDLIIGLKAKERELKKKGRFFALMSWKLREYFVFTEFLIKKEIIPLFKGLTMADDQTTLIKKMMDNTSGQGLTDYECITIANHLDYNKWNNFQRYEATAPVFEVIGKFFGYPKLFSRTHEFFQKAVIYYRDRPDLMKVENGVLLNVDPNQMVVWNGQKGGLEGLRQKGWSVVNLLVIERESGIRNTEVKILAQGDNQVICTFYKIDPHRSDEELKGHLTRMHRNNAAIIARIREATFSIGLLINNDETLQSADMLIYGKNIMYRGNMTVLEEKRYSRITCMTNDQLPSMSSIMSTVSTNCLTVAHYSKSCINSIYNYNWLGNFALNLLEWHNPALRSSPDQIISNKEVMQGVKFRALIIYLDPSLGGISGMSLTRFMIRMFPDPVTEALTFWKMVYHGSEIKDIKDVAITAGNPRILKFKQKHFSKLIEDPPCLNVPRTLSAMNMIKDEIKKGLYRDMGSMRNDIVKDAISYHRDEGTDMDDYLSSIDDCFPRFLSEFKQATYSGIAQGIIGLFENSKTIRNLLRKKMCTDIDKRIMEAEAYGLTLLVKMSIKSRGYMWNCSATHADSLRTESWNRPIVGTTVPHPAEMLSSISQGGIDCADCKQLNHKAAHIVVIIPKGLDNPDDIRGPYPPYFGSSTNESTSLIQTWEKETDISFIRRASELRRAFYWFIDPNSLLGQAIIANIVALTGEDPGKIYEGFKRTGSPLHRFGCSRVSAGGYLANSPTYGSRMIISTDKMARLGSQNYDFMFQSSMIYAQITSGEVHRESSDSCVYHFHIKCLECLRTIKEPNLDTPQVKKFQEKSHILSKWKPVNVNWFKTRPQYPLPVGPWDSLSPALKSQEVGKIQALMFCELRFTTGRDSKVLHDLFPNGMRDYIQGNPYIAGLKEGLVRAACLSAMTQKDFYMVNRKETAVKNMYKTLVHALTNHPDFTTFCTVGSIAKAFLSKKHRIPPSYPANSGDIGAIARSVLMEFPSSVINSPAPVKEWVFVDFKPVALTGIIITAHRMFKILINGSIKTVTRDQTREIVEWYKEMLKGDVSEEMLQSQDRNGDQIYQCKSEIRHAIKEFIEPPEFYDATELATFRNKQCGRINIYPIDYSSIKEPDITLEIPQIQNPLISGIRIPQLATGSYLKLDSILINKKPAIRDFACLGDGSGGCSAAILRGYPTSRCLFNSLIDMTGVNLNGTLPQPPSAIMHMLPHVRDRCMNYLNAWDFSTDLSVQQTWADLVKQRDTYNLSINFIFMDMEVKNEEMSNRIEEHLVRYCRILGSNDVVVLYKTYAARLLNNRSILYHLGQQFDKIEIIQSEWSSSQTSEVYVYASGINKYQTIKEVVMTQLQDDILKLAVFKSYEAEFIRASSVMKYDICTGVPKHLMPNIKIELGGMWHGITGNDNYLENLSDLFFDNFAFDPVSSVLGSLIYISTKVLHITRWKKVKGDVPSDPDLTKFLSYYVGCWLYIALITRDPALGAKVQKLIDNPIWLGIEFYGSTITVLDRTKTPPEMKTITKYNISWHINDPKVEHGKLIYLTRNLAGIGATIRYLLSLSKVSVSINNIMRKFEMFNETADPKLTELLIDEMTDIYYPLKI